MEEAAAGSPEALIVSEFRVDGNPRRFFTLRPFSLGVSIYVLVFRMLLRRKRKSKNMKTLGRRREQERDRKRERDIKRKREREKRATLFKTVPVLVQNRKLLRFWSRYFQASTTTCTVFIQLIHVVCDHATNDAFCSLVLKKNNNLLLSFLIQEV